MSDRPRPDSNTLRLLREAGALVAMLAAALAASVLVVRLVAPRPAAAASGQPGALMRLAEKRVRDLAMRSLEPQLIRDPAVTEPLAEIGARVFAAAGAAAGEASAPTLVVQDSNTVNAFTLPGGLIVVCSGLVRSLGSAEELAAVIAHETAHVTNHDVSRTMARQMGISALFSVFGGREAEVLVQRLLGELINQHYSREIEARADERALRTLEGAGIDPAALADAFGRLKREGDKAPRNVLLYLDSHPDLDARIAAARRASQEALARGAGPWKPFDPQLWSRLRAAL